MRRERQACPGNTNVQFCFPHLARNGSLEFVSPMISQEVAIVRSAAPPASGCRENALVVLVCGTWHAPDGAGIEVKLDDAVDR
jgi:hypothetical protein